jgi:hypothetical protein
VNTGVRKRMERVQKDTESLIATVDSASFLSKRSENSSKLSMLFDFDEQLFTTKPYKAMIRRTVKLSIRSQPRPTMSGSAQVVTRISSNAARSEPYAVGFRSAIESRQSRSDVNIVLLGTLYTN